MIEEVCRCDSLHLVGFLMLGWGRAEEVGGQIIPRKRNLEYSVDSVDWEVVIAEEIIAPKEEDQDRDGKERKDVLW